MHVMAEATVRKKRSFDLFEDSYYSKCGVYLRKYGSLASLVHYIYIGIMIQGCR